MTWKLREFRVPFESDVCCQRGYGIHWGTDDIEEWWQSKDLWRKEATLGDYKYVEIQYGGKNSVYGSSDYIPLRLRQMLDAVLIRIAPDAGTASEWKLKKKELGGSISLFCPVYIYAWR